MLKTSHILSAIKAFELDLRGRVVLTEAASGNYQCTPLLAAASGARVFAYGKDSSYGLLHDIRTDLVQFAKRLGCDEAIAVVDNLTYVPFADVDIVTNTGFLRPINAEMLDKLTSKCVIPLMYEPWELRSTDIDLNHCRQRGIKAIGTNESDPRLRTMSYIGFIVLHLLLTEKQTPHDANILLIGSARFNQSIIEVLTCLGYRATAYATNDFPIDSSIDSYSAIVLTEFVQNRCIVGREDPLIHVNKITLDQLVIHIAGKIETQGLKCRLFPTAPAPPQRMSYTTDFINPKAVVDLHAAGLAVAQGAILARETGIADSDFAKFMQLRYPALLLPEDEC